MTSAKHSRQLGETASENHSWEESNIRLNSENEANPDKPDESLTANVPEDSGIRRSKRFPNTNRTELYGVIMLGL